MSVRASARSSSTTRTDARAGREPGIVVPTSVAPPRKDGLARAELSIAGVAQARDDVADVVQALVHRGHVDSDVGMRAAQTLDPFWRGDQTDVLDALAAPTLED